MIRKGVNVGKILLSLIFFRLISKEKLFIKPHKIITMRSIFLLAATAFLLFLTTAFKTINSTNTHDFQPIEPAIFKVMEVTSLWDLLKANYEPVRERDDTWLDVGLRSKYAMARNYASLDVIEATFGQPVFLRGPHDGDLDFNSTTSFGYYNPDFVLSVHKAVEMAIANPLFSEMGKQVYEKHLMSMAHTYLAAHKYLEEQHELKNTLTQDYLLMMAKPEGTMDGSLQESFRGYAEEVERSAAKSDVYEAFTAPSFWLRRSIDGTDDEFVALLEMVINHFEEGK